MTEPVLKRLRQLLGFTPHEVAAAGGWSRARFAGLESEGALDTSEALTLSDLYGVDVVRVLDEGKVVQKRMPIAALLKGCAESLTADARFAMTEAVAVARDIRELEQLRGEAPRLEITQLQDDDDLRHPTSGNAKRLARLLRARLDLPDVIPSMVRDVCDPLGVLVFASDFMDPLVDAFSTWSAETGPLIVLNTQTGVTRSPLGLRTTLAHEICHLCSDRERMRGIRAFCELDKPEYSTWGDDAPIEQRARAFQVELIAPQEDVLQYWRANGRDDAASDIAQLSEHFGIGPVAVAYQLRNAGGPDFTSPAPMVVGRDGWDEWSVLSVLRTADSAIEAEIRPFRRGRLYQLVRVSIEDGSLSDSWGRELLRLDLTGWESLRRTWAKS